MILTNAPECDAAPSPATLSLGVSIVLYKMPVAEILPLVQDLLTQRARLVYLIDNSPPGFDAFAGWTPPDRVLTVSTRRNLGYGRAHNLAIRDSVRRHVYHLVSNPDITLGEHTLRALIEMMERRREVGLCMPRIVGVDGSLQYLCKLAPSPVDFFIRQVAPEYWFQRRRAKFEMRVEPTSYEREMSPEYMTGCFMFFRSSTLAAIDGFDERYFMYLEDLDISRRAKRIAANLYYPHESIVHVHQKGSHRSLRLFLYIAASAFKYFSKWGWFEQPWFRK
jgi:GT2 family glycosyltransferase